mmetsp:Transcript_51577/g.144122  ORF Transcript_51577/g.144122 Transcript_51577/m.144122 type:complete len:263 (-) Transcript_51577:113-901(-)
MKRGDAQAVLLTRVVKISQTPIDESQLLVGVVDGDVAGLHIPVHHALGMRIIQGLEELENVMADVVVRESRVQPLRVCVLDKLKNQARLLGLWILYDVHELDDVGATSKTIQNVDLSLEFPRVLHLQPLDCTPVAAVFMETIEDLAVRAAAYLPRRDIVHCGSQGQRAEFVTPALPVHSRVCVWAELWRGLGFHATQCTSRATMLGVTSCATPKTTPPISRAAGEDSAGRHGSEEQCHVESVRVGLICSHQQGTRGQGAQAR